MKFERRQPMLSGQIVATAADAGRAIAPQALIDDYLPPTARELIVKGMPENTLKAYAQQWRAFRLWCEETGRTPAPARENTMVAYLDQWRTRPVHIRCGGGPACTGRGGPHRPSPSTAWLWYSAVRFYHGVGEPPLPWEIGKKLALALKGYATEMVELGWEPDRAPRAHDVDVTRMVDSCDLDTGQGLRDRALLLVNFYTAARASDLATYRIRDVVPVPKGVELSLRQSKTNKRVGKLIEKRRIFANRERPQYCGVAALDAWTGWLAAAGVTGGALFRPFDRWGHLVRGAPDAVSYRMQSVNITRAVTKAAVRAGLPNGPDYTSHSLRRGRATQQRELGADPIEIARAYGWVPGGSIVEYLEEAEGWSAAAPGAVGAL